MGSLNLNHARDIFSDRESPFVPYVSLDGKFVFLVVGGICALLVILLLLILVICKFKRIRPIYKNPVAMTYIVLISLGLVITPIFLPSFIRRRSTSHLFETMRLLAYCSSLKITNSPAMVEYLCNPDFTGTYLTETEKKETKSIFKEFVVENPDDLFDFAIFLSQQGYERIIHRSHWFPPGDVNMFSAVEVYKDGKITEQFKMVAGDTLVFDRFEQYGPLFGFSGFLQYMNKNPTAKRFRCARALRNLWGGLYMYAQDRTGHLPDPNRWCDVTKGSFVGDIWNISECSGYFDPCENGYSINPECEGKDPSLVRSWGICQRKYAMNPNCRPDSPPDTVLLFESKPGWNQFGGPEILDANHHQPSGCNILFKDGSIRFIRKEDLYKLKW